MYPLFQLWAPAYSSTVQERDDHPGGGAQVRAISDAAAGVVDIGASDAYLSSRRSPSTRACKNIPLAISAQMVNYNIPGLSGPVHLRLNGQVISPRSIRARSPTGTTRPSPTLNPGVPLPATPIVAAAPLRQQRRHVHLQPATCPTRTPSGWANEHRLRHHDQPSPAISNALGETATVAW